MSKNFVYQTLDLAEKFEVKNQGLCEGFRERKFEDKWKRGRQWNYIRGAKRIPISGTAKKKNACRSPVTNECKALLFQKQTVHCHLFCAAVREKRKMYVENK